jgi:hypothetical protein
VIPALRCLILTGIIETTPSPNVNGNHLCFRQGKEKAGTNGTARPVAATKGKSDGVPPPAAPRFSLFAKAVGTKGPLFLA